jgi:hypothetical protein
MLWVSAFHFLVHVMRADGSATEIVSCTRGRGNRWTF